MIKLINNRCRCGGGSLFHYAHFICDCLFPEIISDVFNYGEVFREKIPFQTIGYFDKIYTDVLRIKNTELNSDYFKNLTVPVLKYKKKEEYLDKIYFDKFRKFIFERYNINHLEYNNDYPEIILIKRGGRIKLADNKVNVSTGKERREIHNIIKVENLLQNKYKNKFKSLYFENLPFEEQVKYFNNAKIIVCAHGAVMSNMFFCKKKTKIIEVTCDKEWPFFLSMIKILNLNHIKCDENNFKSLARIINSLDVESSNPELQPQTNELNDATKIK